MLCGGYGGVMEAVCRGAAQAEGSAVGVVLAGRGGPNRWVSRAIAAEDLGRRLTLLRDDAAAWIVLPRGLGTLLEIVWLAESVVKEEAPARPLVFLGDFWRASVGMALAEAAGPGAEALTKSIRWAKTPEEAVALAFGESP